MARYKPLSARGTFLATGLLIGLAASAMGTAHARAPDGTSPGPSCKAYTAGHSASAKSQDKARQRARGKWEHAAWSKFGLAYNDWHWSAYKQYGCSKKGSKWHCVAEAYPCKKPYY